MRRIGLGFALSFVALAHGSVLAQSARLGHTTFPNSGTSAAQAAFLDGVLLLHSFEYARAAEAFRQAQRSDPNFALAFWGEAMTYNHPVWFEQNADSARAVLQRLAPTPEQRRAMAGSELEKGLLDAVESLYGPGPKALRDTAYAGAMRQVYERYPDDENVASFYALALLGTSHGGRHVPTYLHAAEIVEKVFARNPKHPGAAHYLIHAYDDPQHAARGLAAARAYSGIAPDAPHAQHMTTHIFVALGMWDEVVAQNEIASGHDHGRWMPGHYTVWLGYGYLQQGRLRDAYAHLERMRAQLRPDAPQQRAALSRLRADYVTNTGEWDSPALAWPINLENLPVASVAATDAFVRGAAALSRKDRAGAGRAFAEIQKQALIAGNNADPNDQSAGIITVLLKELSGLLKLEDRADPADVIATLREATAAEDKLTYEFGPPAVVKPAHELLGEVLLQMGKPAEAVAELKSALERTPKRARTLVALARAAEAAKDTALATETHKTLTEIWHRADRTTGTR
jgi:tetratricopeptide (TPR) repeat protein